MGNYVRGILTGLGVGLLFGWSLGVSGITPGHGWPLWAVTSLGITLIFAGGSGLRKHLRKPGVSER